MPEIAVIAALAAALVVVTLLWRRECRRVRRLERELEAERSRRSGRPVSPLKAVAETLGRLRDEGLGEVIKSSFEELTSGLDEAEPDLRRLAGRDGTLTIFFSDIENSTALNEEYGDRKWLKILSGHDRIVRRYVSTHNGYVVKGQGDGYMIAFAEPAHAVLAAIAIQRELAREPRRLQGAPIKVRMGIHTGPALEKDGDLFGRNVALAARIADESAAGEILVSEEIAIATDGEPGLTLTPDREVELKGLGGTHRLLRAEWREA